MKKKVIFLLCFLGIIAFISSYLLAKLLHNIGRYKVCNDTTTVCINNSEPDLSDETDKRYAEIKNKDEINYNTTTDDTLLCETENGLSVIESPSDSSDPENKYYKYVLSKYTYYSELDSIDISIDEAIQKIYEVLPDDIVESKRKIDNNSGFIYIFYKSSSGNFIASLNTKILDCTNGIYTYDTNKIVGISYLKEFN